MSLGQHRQSSAKQELKVRLLDLAQYLADGDWQHDVPRAVSTQKTLEVEFEDEDQEEAVYAKLTHSYKARKIDLERQKLRYTVSRQETKDIAYDSLTEHIKRQAEQKAYHKIYGKDAGTGFIPSGLVDWDSSQVAAVEYESYLFDGSARLLAHRVKHSIVLNGHTPLQSAEYVWPAAANKDFSNPSLVRPLLQEVPFARDVLIGGLNMEQHRQNALAMLAIVTPRHIW